MTTDTLPEVPPPARCELCGEPMPPGEEMFKYHGYSGPCPKPPARHEPTKFNIHTALCLKLKRWAQDFDVRTGPHGGTQEEVELRQAIVSLGVGTLECKLCQAAIGPYVPSQLRIAQAMADGEAQAAANTADYSRPSGGTNRPNNNRSNRDD